MNRYFVVALVMIASLCSIGFAEVDHGTVVAVEPHKNGKTRVHLRLKDSNREVVAVVKDTNGKAFTTEVGSDIQVMRLPTAKPDSKQAKKP